MNKILSDREVLLMKHSFHLPEETKAKMKTVFLKVWSSHYLLQQLGLDKNNKEVIALDGITYRLNSKHDMFYLLQCSQIGLSFRALNAYEGYVIAKEWKEKPVAIHR